MADYDNDEEPLEGRLEVRRPPPKTSTTMPAAAGQRPIKSGLSAANLLRMAA
jgi:hypothetical protein